MMIVGGNSVAGYLSKNLRAMAARGLEFFQREQGRAFTQHHAGAIGIEGSAFFRRRSLQRLEANKHVLGERVITASQNALVAAGANRVKSVTDCVCARGASIRDYLSWSVDAKSFHGINDLFLRRIVCDQSCRTSTAVPQAAVKILSETHAPAGGTDNRDFRLELPRALQKFG